MCLRSFYKTASNVNARKVVGNIDRILSIMWPYTITCLLSPVLLSSETQGLLAGTMQYFWAKVYFKIWRAAGNLFLPNQFQKWSNSIPLIGQKNIFLPNQWWGLVRKLCRLLTRSSFFIDQLDCLARATGTTTTTTTTFYFTLKNYKYKYNYK